MISAVPFVHNKETSERFVLPDTFQGHRAALNPVSWRASGEFYYTVDAELDTAYLPKWEDCRKYSWFVRHKITGQVRVLSSACRLRWCSLCSDARRGYITHQVANWIQKTKYPKFLTVTLKHSNAPLAHQVDCLYSFFRKFRRAKFVRESAIGGIWFFQIKRSKKSGQWHPHIHCVVEGAYMPQRKLSRLWNQITNGSKVVDIRPVRDVMKGAAEVARYASTPADLETTSPTDYVELFKSLHGRRSCGTWGTAKKVSLRQPVADDKESWESIGSWTTVSNAQTTDPAAAEIIKAWLTDKPLDSDITMAYDRRKEVEAGAKALRERPPPYLPGFYITPAYMKEAS